MGADRLRFGLACAVLQCTLSTLPAAAFAQGTAVGAPATHDMIEALKPARQRNLVVRPSAAPAASAPLAAPLADLVPAPAPAPVAVTPGPAPAPVQPVPVATPLATAPASPPETPPSLSLAIQFDLNSARVRPESGTVLGNLVAAMLSADLRGNRFLIEGHTDARGNPGANKVLSQQRAEEVRLYLVALGVHPSRLKAVGKGSSELANPRDPLAGDNRRVRVVTLE